MRITWVSALQGLTPSEVSPPIPGGNVSLLFREKTTRETKHGAHRYTARAAKGQAGGRSPDLP